MQPALVLVHGDLSSATIAEWEDSIVADIEEAELDPVALVGHSLAGVIVPGVVAKLGAERVREMIFAAAFVPPQGSARSSTVSEES